MILPLRHKKHVVSKETTMNTKKPPYAIQLLLKAQNECFTLSHHLQDLDESEAQRALRIHEQIVKALHLLEKHDTEGKL